MKTNWTSRAGGSNPFFKTNWNPDLLLAVNYMSHLLALRKSVLTEIGGFRLGLDGSQDHDLVRRFTERTSRIKHIPKILLEEVAGWQSPGLDATFAVVFFDALRVKIRNEGMVSNRAVYLAIGVCSSGYKEIMGIWIGQT
jgi:hypothetical protein